MASRKPDRGEKSPPNYPNLANATFWSPRSVYSSADDVAYRPSLLYMPGCILCLYIKKLATNFDA